MPSKQAEAITGAITEVLNDSLENVAHSFVSKGEMQKVRSFLHMFLRQFLCVYIHEDFTSWCANFCIFLLDS